MKHDLTWKLDGACRGEDVNIWFPDDGDYTKQAEAKAICRQCPVIANCLAYALDIGEPIGIYGGKSGRERRKIRARARLSTRTINDLDEVSGW